MVPGTHMFGSGSQLGSCVRICCVRVVRLVNVFSQEISSHLYGRFPVCVLRCRARLLESPKVLPQPGYSQEWGFSPVCTRRWTCRADRCKEVRLEYLYFCLKQSYLNKSLSTAGMAAKKRAFTSVYPHVPNQIASTGECFLALVVITGMQLFDLGADDRRESRRRSDGLRWTGSIRRGQHGRRGGSGRNLRGIALGVGDDRG